MATIVTPPPPPPQTPRASKKPPIGTGRLRGSKNKYQKDAKWILEEAVRLNGGLEWVTRWMKDHPDISIPMYIRAMVPKAVEVTTDASEVTHIHVHKLLPEPSLPPQRMHAVVPTRQKLTYDRLHPSASWGEKEPEVYEDGELIPNSADTSSPSPSREEHDGRGVRSQIQ
jgi:hypothetical protein